MVRLLVYFVKKLGRVRMSLSLILRSVCVILGDLMLLVRWIRIILGIILGYGVRLFKHLKKWIRLKK